MSVPDLPFVGQKNWGSPLNAGIEARTNSDYLADKLAEDGPFRSSLLSTIDTRVSDGLGDLDGADTGAAGLALLAAALPADAREALGITVDTSVGTRVMVGGVMIYGDTGWRDITSPATDALDPSNTGTIRLRREGSTVSLALQGVSLLPGDGPLVIGPMWQSFWPTTNRFLSSVASVSGDSFQANEFLVLNQYAWFARRQLDTGEVSQTRTSDPIIGVITYTTSQPWPSSLPGSPL